jgi:hypothetical protein
VSSQAQPSRFAVVNIRVEVTESIVPFGPERGLA